MPSLSFAIVSKHRLEKKEQGIKPCSKIVSTLNFPENLDLILIVEATLHEIIGADWSDEIDAAWRRLLDEIEVVVAAQCENSQP